MRLSEIKMSSVYYHGSPDKFETFDTEVESRNRTGNPTGVYLTPDKHEAAEGYADKGGYVYTVTTSAKNPFIYYKSKVSDEMAKLFGVLLKKHTTYNSDWVDKSIVPSFVKDSKFPDIPGWIKTKVMQAGGYDYWKDGRHICVFDANDITIHNIEKSNPARFANELPPEEDTDFPKADSLTDLVRTGKETGVVDKRSVADVIADDVTDEQMSEVEKMFNDIGIEFK